MHKSPFKFKATKNYDFRLKKNELFKYKGVFDVFDVGAEGKISCKHLPTALRACLFYIGI